MDFETLYREIENAKIHERKTSFELFYLWMFISQENLLDEAESFLSEHVGECFPAILN